MKVLVELNGLARELVGGTNVELTLMDGESYQGVVEALAKEKPELVGVLIDSDRKTFLSSNMFIINGDMSQPAMMMDETPQDGDRLTIISPITGG